MMHNAPFIHIWQRDHKNIVVTYRFIDCIGTHSLKGKLSLSHPAHTLQSLKLRDVTSKQNHAVYVQKNMSFFWLFNMFKIIFYHSLSFKTWQMLIFLHIFLLIKPAWSDNPTVLAALSRMAWAALIFGEIGSQKACGLRSKQESFAGNNHWLTCQFASASYHLTINEPWLT